jgi:hypothetical protein
MLLREKHSPVFYSLTNGVPVSATTERTVAHEATRLKYKQEQKGGTMTTQSTTSIYKSAPGILRLALLSILITAAPLLAPASDFGHDHTPARLVQIVRDATQQFIHVSNTKDAGYGPAFGCVSGPDHGAMGIHYINGPLVGDGVIDARYPEALIYEPVGHKRRLVGVEYIVDSATWLAAHDNVPPQLEGQAFQLVGSPNRYALPPFFELHVWAWRENPNGAFVDWNNRVSCEGQ